MQKRRREWHRDGATGEENAGYLHSTVDASEATVALANGSARAATNGKERCFRAEHNRCDDHGADRARKRRDARENDSPSDDYVEAHQLFEAKCDEWGIAKEDRFRFGEPLTRKQTANLTKTDRFSGWFVPSIKIYYQGLDGKRTNFVQLRFLVCTLDWRLFRARAARRLGR